jgi:hypothetical protein
VKPQAQPPIPRLPLSARLWILFGRFILWQYNQYQKRSPVLMSLEKAGAPVEGEGTQE